MKRILIAIHSLKVGGMEKVTSGLVNYLAHKEDLEIHLMLYGIKRDVFYEINPNITIHKPSFEFDNNNRILSALKTLVFLRNTIKDLNPHSVLSFGEYWNNMILLSMIGLRIPVYIADRSTPLKDLGKLQNLLRTLLYPKAKGLIVQTKLAKKIYIKKFRKLNIEVIGNPISSINSSTVKRENVILTVSRLIETKHIDRLITIFSKLRVPEWKLVVVGENAKKQNTRERLEKLVYDMNLTKRVVFAGNQKDVNSFYLKSKIFAFTSSSEGFPNVIVEAMAAGLPVISYDCAAGPSEIITNGEDGFLIPLFDDCLFQKKLEYLMENEEIRYKMGLKAATIKDKFRCDIIYERFLKMILH